MPRVTTSAATFLFFALLCLPADLRAQDSCDSACPPDQKCFSGCGTLVQGVECVLFQADLGGLYILSNVGPFSVGDRGFVTGCIDPSCISFCQQGDGCILNNTIATCDDKHDFDGDGIGDSLDNCSQAANPAQDDTDLDDCGNLCDADYTQTGIVSIGDFGFFINRCIGAIGGFPCVCQHREPICVPGRVVGIGDFGFFAASFGSVPGPSGTTAGTTACP